MNTNEKPDQFVEYVEYCDIMYSQELNKLSIKDLKNKRSVMQNLTPLSPSFDVYFMIDKIDEELENRIEH